MKWKLFAFDTKDGIYFAKGKQKTIKCDGLIYGTEIHLQIHDDVLLDYF